ncbi:MAG: hypothetical protein JWM93_2022 [Frankiales bacterium]|nr:hypothetical protein [Frankiales bacterium]
MRTPEQIAADDALSAAIDGHLRAYYPDETSPGVSGEYVVVATWQLWDDAGEGSTRYVVIPRDQDVPVHRLVGLLDYALTRKRAFIAED